MKANRLFPGYGTLFVLAISLLSSAVGKAQTVTSQQTPAELSSGFEAVVFPLSTRPSTIKVIFNNPTGGAVQVMIKDQEGNVFYDESESITQYRRSFDLTPLPEGNYTVVLKKHKENFTQEFAIKQPVIVQSQIALVNPPTQKKFDKRADKKLIVSQ
ncbi:DUF3244 domain-containing protein [Spirosoma pollinicola]|uniref:Secretion system C-terminal sorting domain-containing protein n=1 Tax=Spirosoma pollinicola TaxID=2057025 RepID=A0A2K8YTC2_9BACT|nr:DUF3244 domain-containing protein [Spirosoma pollinicola]AUD00860.1 hypothetical protein CWM47_02935 [Spirosoma pollinicola]